MSRSGVGPRDGRARDTALVVAALALIAAATLWPVPGAARIRLACLWCSRRFAADALLNIALYAPLGAALARRRPAWHAVLGAMLLSAAIEGAQYFMGGRTASPVDVLTNTAGAGLGAWLVLRCHAWRGLLDDARAAVAAALLAAAVPAAGAWLMQTSYPATAWFSQWTAHLYGFETVRGRLESATLDDLPLPQGRLADPQAVRTALQRGARLALRARLDEFPLRLAPLFSVADTAARGIVMLGVDREDLVFRRRLRAVSWGFAQPELRLAGAFAAIPPGEPADVMARGRDGGWCLTVRGAAGTRERCGLRFPVARGWGLLVDSGRRLAAAAPLLDVLWMTFMTLPLGLLAAGRSGLVLAGAVALTLLLVPVAFAGMTATPAGWAGFVLGLLLGRLARNALKDRSLRPGTRPA